MSCLGLGLSGILVLLHGRTVSGDLVLAAGTLGLALRILVRLTGRMTLVLAAVLQLLVDKAEALEAELRVELLGLLDGLVDQAHTGGVVTTEVGLEAEEDNALLILDLELGGQLLLEILLGDGGEAGVQDVNGEPFFRQKMQNLTTN